MTQSPAAPPRTLRPFGRVHIVGIGGIGMSGIAEVMHVMGYEVQGSIGRECQYAQAVGYGCAGNDRSSRGKYCRCGCRHRVVGGYTRQCRDAGCARAPHSRVRRAEMLAELMRLKPCLTVAGTHGKTTTTRWPLPCLMLRARSHRYQWRHYQCLWHNARLGSGDWMVVEADESDGTCAPALDHGHCHQYRSRTFGALRQF